MNIKVVHKVASRFSVNDSDLQLKLEVMLKEYCARCECLGPERADFAEFTKVSAPLRTAISSCLHQNVPHHPSVSPYSP